MKELSLNILDIAENSIKAKAELIEIAILEDDSTLIIEINDNGVGMSEEALRSVCDPFYTSRTTRKVGMGIPLFRLAAEQTEGGLIISSKHIDDFPADHGTNVKAHFNKSHIDFTPLGDIISTLTTLIQGHPCADFCFTHKHLGQTVSLDTRQMRQVLGDIPLDTYEVLAWIKENLTEQYKNINK